MRVYRGERFRSRARAGLGRALLCLGLVSLVSACDDDPSPRRISLGVASKPGIGSYLTDGDGRAVYGFTGDAEGQSACLTNCATVWPPVLTRELPSLGDASIDAAKLTLLVRPDTSSQLVYKARPLYYYDDDKKEGGTSGHGARGFGGLFSLVSPAGKLIASPR